MDTKICNWNILVEREVILAFFQSGQVFPFLRKQQPLRTSLEEPWVRNESVRAVGVRSGLPLPQCKSWFCHFILLSLGLTFPHL